MKFSIVFFLFLSSVFSWAQEKSKNQDSETQVLRLEKVDSYYDPTIDYSIFTGRVTDKEMEKNFFKIYSRNENVKFFRVGDSVEFKPLNSEGQACFGTVRNVEKEGYFVLHVKNFSQCFDRDFYFRRGTLLSFDAKILAQRVKDASIHRKQLLQRKTSYLSELNDINHFVWSYDQQKVLLVGEYDQKILELEKAKRKALEQLALRKKESFVLQKELAFQLDKIDHDLQYYRVHQYNMTPDKWSFDQDLGKPVEKKPDKFINLE